MAFQLGVWDYVVFAVTILLTALIGGYRIYKDHVKKAKVEYFLFTKRASGFFPIVMSSVATLLSGISLLAAPGEAYVGGIAVFNFHLSFIFASFIITYVYLPVYYDLNVTSVMEYIEMRFNRILRIFAAICYFLSQIMNSAVILQLPALALNRVTGIGIWESMAPMAIICTLYTAMGGFKAVIWTDVFQAFLMFATILLVITKGLIDIGGFGVLWERLSNGGRTTFFNLTPRPTIRYTFWTNYTGGIIMRLMAFTDQSMVQRQLASRTMKSAKMSVYVTCAITFICSMSTSLFGLIIYARYFDCDPIRSGQITSRDQLSPHFAMEILHNFSGLGGFFVGGIVAATLSTLSSSINSLSLIAIHDFVKPFYGNISSETSAKLSKIFAVAIGLATLAFVLVFQNFESALEAVNAARGVTGGPLLGLTTLGMLVPFASNLGCAVGCIAGSAMALWVIVGASVSKYIHPYAPVETYGCNETLGHNYTFPTANYSSMPYVEHNASIFPLYTISFQLYAFVGCFTTIVVGTIVSLITGPQNPENLPQGVIHPGIQKLYKKLPDWLKLRYRFKTTNANSNAPEEEMMNIPKETEAEVLH